MSDPINKEMINSANSPSNSTPTSPEPSADITASVPLEPTEKKENIWINLLFNIVAPTLILSKFSGEDALGTTTALIVALAFPFFYGLMDFTQRKKINVFSILGIISTLLTGTISLLQMPPEYIAIKEAAIPGMIFFIVLISTKTPYPLVEKLIFNDAIFNLEKLKKVIREQNNEAQLHKIMTRCSYLVAASFALSSVLNYILAVIIVVSPANTVAYNEELAKMMALSYPVIALPSMIVMGSALFYFMRKIQKLTGHDIEDYLVMQSK